MSGIIGNNQALSSAKPDAASLIGDTVTKMIREALRFAESQDSDVDLSSLRIEIGRDAHRHDVLAAKVEVLTRERNPTVSAPKAVALALHEREKRRGD